MGRRPAAALLLALAVAAPAVAGGGRPVTTVTVEADGPVSREEVLGTLGLEAGAPLDPARLRRGVRVLWARGRIDDVVVTSEPDGDGVAVRVRLFLRPRIESVEVTGVEGRTRRKVRGWLGLVRGELFTAAALERACDRVVKRLVEEGYPEASAEPSVEYDPAADAVRITVAVDRGKPDRLDRVVIVGVPDPEGELAAAAGLDAGDILTARRIERARTAVERALRREGYWDGAVTGVRRRRTASGTVLELEVDPGPRWRLEIAGDEDVRHLVRAVLPDPEAGDLHPDQAGYVEQRILEGLQARGYLLATVSVRIGREDGARSLAIEAKPGPRVRIEAVRFPGASAIAPRELRRTVRVRPGRVGGWRGRRVTGTTLEADRQAVEGLYRSRGFVEVSVDPPRIEPAEAGDRVRIVFPVHEGRRWRLSELRLEGFPVEVLAALEGPLPLKEEGPWNPGAVGPARQALELALASAGYPDGRVEVDVDTSRPGEARVTVRAVPGPYVTLGEVVVAGLRTTATSVVRKILTRHGVATGRPYSLSAILDAQQELYELGLFRRIDIVPLPGEERGPRRGLLVRCEEGRQRSYVLGVGWDTDSRARLIVGWSHLNLLGHAHALGVEARLSSREQRFQATLREHDVLDLGVPAYVSLYKTEETFTSFAQHRRGLWIDVGDRRRRPYRRWLRYEYQRVEPDAPDDILSELERQEQRIRIASLTPTLEWDTRDDPLDPGRGVLASFSAQYAFPLLKAEAHFLKLDGRLGLFGPFLGGTGALGLHLGAIHPVGIGGVEPENLKIPIGARYFAGGRVSHRAFPIDRLGIPGETIDENGNPIGGNAIVILNLEWRHPIRGIVSGVVFLDAGNVWADPSRVSPGDVRWGAGIGLRIHTPAGPLRLEYGSKLDRKPGESRGELTFSFGTAF